MPLCILHKFDLIFQKPLQALLFLATNFNRDNNTWV